MNSQNGSAPNTPMQQKPKKPFYKKWWFWVIIVLIAGAIGAGSSGANKGKDSKKTTETTTISATSAEITTTVQPTTKSKKVSEGEYKNSCKKVTYKDLSRNPDKHKGEKLTYTGQVIQVQEDEHLLDDNTTVNLRINVTKDKYGIWKDTIFATVELPKGADRILEDDIITIWGKCAGKYSYTSVLGAEVTLPKIDTRYYKIK